MRAIILRQGHGRSSDPAATASLVRLDDGAEEPVHRPAGGDALKSPASTYQKAASIGRDHAPDLSEVRDLLRSAIFVTIGIAATSLVIGAYQAEPESIRDCLMSAGWLLMLGWIGTLIVVAMVSFARITPGIFRQVARKALRRPKVAGGVEDEWLDGPA